MINLRMHLDLNDGENRHLLTSVLDSMLSVARCIAGQERRQQTVSNIFVVLGHIVA